MSRTPRNVLITATTINTTMVKLVASCRVGQVTFRNSPIVSREYREMKFGCLRADFLSALATDNSFEQFYSGYEYYKQ
jgi:hypothetical protein